MPGRSGGPSSISGSVGLGPSAAHQRNQMFTETKNGSKIAATISSPKHTRQANVPDPGPWSKQVVTTRIATKNFMKLLGPLGAKPDMGNEALPLGVTEVTREEGQLDLWGVASKCDLDSLFFVRLASEVLEAQGELGHVERCPHPLVKARTHMERFEKPSKTQCRNLLDTSPSSFSSGKSSKGPKKNTFTKFSTAISVWIWTALVVNVELCQKLITRDLTAKLMNTLEAVTENLLNDAEDVGVLSEQGIGHRKR